MRSHSMQYILLLVFSKKKEIIVSFKHYALISLKVTVYIKKIEKQEIKSSAFVSVLGKGVI